MRLEHLAGGAALLFGLALCYFAGLQSQAITSMLRDKEGNEISKLDQVFASPLLMIFECGTPEAWRMWRRMAAVGLLGLVFFVLGSFILLAT